MTDNFALFFDFYFELTLKHCEDTNALNFNSKSGNRLHYPGFYLALFAKNKFLLTSFIVLFVYMSYFTKIASSLRLLVTSSKLAPASTESLACACLK